MKKVQVVTHPIVLEKLAVLRDVATTSYSFRQILNEISFFLAYESTRDLKTALKSVTTPLETAKLPRVIEDVCVISVLRAGEGMLDGFLKTLPFAQVGHIGIYRDKNLNSHLSHSHYHQ